MRRARPPRAALLPLPLSFLIGCGASVPATRRDRPSARTVHAAFERATPLAARCLRANDRVTVEGFFDGPTGRYRVERVGASDAATPDAVRRCVALQLEAARVRPFGAARHDARWTVADDVSPEVRAMLAADASVADAPDRAGEVDVAAVERAVAAQRGEFQRCYELAARGAPGLRGAMTVRVTISVDGRVTEGEVTRAAAGLRDVGHCVVGHLRTVPLPRPLEAAVVFEFSLDFAPGDAGAPTGSRP